MISTSELGNEVVTYSGTREIVGVFEHASQRVSLSIEKAGEVLDISKAKKEEAKPEVRNDPISSSDLGLVGKAGALRSPKDL
jgi:hypothetical protein